MNGECSGTTKQSEIATSFGDLDSSISNLAKTSDILIGRIQSILSPAEPQKENQCTSNDKPHLCQIANSIREASDRIIKITDSLNYEINRIQL